MFPESHQRRFFEAAKEIERLQAVMDAADAFLAEPPEDMKERHPFNQYTTAGDCRALSEAYRKASDQCDGPQRKGRIHDTY